MHLVGFIKKNYPMTTSASRVQIVLEMAISDQKKKDYTDDGAGCAPKDILVCSVACDIYIYIYIYIYFFFFFVLWRCDPTRAMVSPFLRFLDHTHQRTTVGRTPLDG